MDEEIWRPIKGYEGLYDVSNFGKVRRCTRDQAYTVVSKDGVQSTRTHHFREMPIKISWNARYPKVALRKDGKYSLRSLTFIVAKTFVPNPENKKCVIHLDHDIFNNNASNLKWVNHIELINFNKTRPIGMP